MKVTCLQENLDRGLSIVSRAISSRTTLPITNNILLATDQERLKLVATNLEIAISYWIGAKVEEEGSITLPARLLGDFVHSIPQDTVSMHLLSGRKVVEVKCCRFEARMNGVDAKDFPPIPKVGEGLNAEIDAAMLRKALPRVVFAASTEDNRPVLTGVSVKFEGDMLTLASADGYRLAVYNLPLGKNIEEDVEVIVPAKTLGELNRLISDKEEPVAVTISSNKSQILFRLKNLEVVSQLIQGTFPTYEQLIPETFTTKMVIDIGDFRQVVKTAWIFAQASRSTIRLVVAPGQDTLPGKLTVSGVSEEIGDDSGEADAIVEGGGKIAFDGRYLNQLLSVLDEDRVVMEINEVHRPALFRPDGDDSYKHVIMPQMVQW